MADETIRLSAATVADIACFVTTALRLIPDPERVRTGASETRDVSKSPYAIARQEFARLDEQVQARRTGERILAAIRAHKDAPHG